MAVINKKLVHFRTRAKFEERLAAKDILDTSIVFIQDEKIIWTHGTYYSGEGIDFSADEEDLTDLEGVLKFKDREYEPDNFSGLGYKILRKNIKGVIISVYELTITNGCTTDGTISVTVGDGSPIDISVTTTDHNTPESVAQLIQSKIEGSTVSGSVVESKLSLWVEYNDTGITGRVESIATGVINKNVLTQSMINEANTVYEIRYDFDLNGATITIPENCVLKFHRGSLSNGIIVLGYKVLIEGNNSQFNNTRIIPGHSSNIQDLNLRYSSSQNSILIDSEYLKASVDNSTNFDISINGTRASTTVDIKLKNITIYNSSDSSDNLNSAIISYSHTTKYGYWGVYVENINIYGKFNYGIEIKNANEGWQTNQLWQYGKMFGVINSIFVGYEEETIGSKPSNIIFFNISSQSYSSTERFAIIKGGEDIVFNHCEPWDWQNVKSGNKQFLVDASLSRVEIQTAKTNTVSSIVDFYYSEEENPISGVVSIKDPINSSLGVTTTFTNKILPNINLESSLKVSDILLLPSGVYNISLDNNLFKVLGSPSISNIVSNSVLLHVYKHRYGVSLHLTPSIVRKSSQTNPIWGGAWTSVSYNDDKDLTLEEIGWTYYQTLNVFDSDKNPIQNAANVKGLQEFNTTENRPKWWTGSRYVTADGFDGSLQKAGVGSSRPTPSSSDIGFQYFDTDLGRTITWNGSSWVDPTSNIDWEVIE